MCKGKDFEIRQGVMETRGAMWAGFAWAQRGKTQFICNDCGYIHSFADPR